MVGGKPSFFEGTEKKVELVVDPSLPSFRERGDDFWRDLSRHARAEVLSKIANDHCDAYLLSESSLFVFDHKLIMITCGRTTLPEAVRELLGTVSPDRVRLLVYERKNEAFPHRQPTSFFEDVRELRTELPGRAFRFGHEDEHHLHLFHLDRAFEDVDDDMTVEILMHGLDRESRGQFRAGADSLARVRSRTGMDRILPGFAFDDHLFQPDGYSLNALKDDEYYTVHVTPEEVSSYASFETNHRFDGDLDDMVGRVLSIFRPRSYDLVLFDRAGHWRVEPEGYRLKSHIVQELNCGYRAQFLNFYRPQEGAEPAFELTAT